MNPFTWIWRLVPPVKSSVSPSERVSETWRPMDFVLSVAIYLALGIALVAAAIWYGTAVGQRFFASDR
jgi:hypothetical protein